MIITQNDLSANYINEATILNEYESKFNPSMVPVIESRDSYKVDHSYVERVSESQDCTYLEALNLIEQVNGIKNVHVAIDEAKAILNPKLLSLYENVYIKPISENSLIYLVCESILESAIEEEEFDLLDEAEETNYFNTGYSPTFRKQTKQEKIEQRIKDSTPGGFGNPRANASKPFGFTSEDSAKAKLAQQIKNDNPGGFGNPRANASKPFGPSSNNSTPKQTAKNDYSGFGNPRAHVYEKDPISTTKSVPTTGTTGKEEKNVAKEVSDAQQQGASVEAQAKKVENSKDPNIIARAIASFRKLYHKFMARTQSIERRYARMSPSEQNKFKGRKNIFKRIAAKILSVIDRLASKLQYLVDRRKDSEMSDSDLRARKLVGTRYNREYKGR